MFFHSLILDKSDGDSMASKREGIAKAERAFKLFDKDNDGYITKEEFQKISKKLNKEQVQKSIGFRVRITLTLQILTLIPAKCIVIFCN